MISWALINRSSCGFGFVKQSAVDVTCWLASIVIEEQAFLWNIGSGAFVIVVVPSSITSMKAVPSNSMKRVDSFIPLAVAAWINPLAKNADSMVPFPVHIVIRLLGNITKLVSFSFGFAALQYSNAYELSDVITWYCDCDFNFLFFQQFLNSYQYSTLLCRYKRAK